MAREMKDSGVEWIGEIPRDWEVVKLKTYFSFEKGKNASIYTQEYIGQNIGEFPVYSGQTENNGIMGKINCYDYDIDECLFTTTVGAKVMTPKILKGKFNLSQNCLIMKKEKECFINFFYYMLLPLFSYEKSLIPNYMQPSLRMEDLRRYKFYIPPLEEQEKIANYLDKKVSDIDLIIEKTKITIEDYKKYKQSIITEAVTKGINPDVEMKDSGIEWIGEIPREWEVAKLKYIAQLNPKIDIKHLEETSEVTFTPMEKIKNGYFINNKGIWGNNNSSYTNYSENDIVMAKVTPCFENGNIAIMKGLYNNIGFGSSELFVFRSYKNIKKEYLFYFLRNEIFKNLGKNNMTGAGGLKRVPSEFILNFNVSVPPLKEQNQIAEYLDKKTSEIDTLITKKENLIKELEEYKKSLIYECVTGKKEIK